MILIQMIYYLEKLLMWMFIRGSVSNAQCLSGGP